MAENKRCLWDFVSKSSEEEKVGAKDLYDLMWRCRDLEIDNLWKRSTLLATFLVIFWTGLGYTFYKYIDLRLYNEKVFVLRSALGNFFLLGIQIYAMLGSFISLLWICMTKGSKAWVEFFEGHIDCIKYEKNREMFFSDDLVKRLKNGEYIPYNGKVPEKFSRDWNNSILKPSGGAFSPSRINVVIGIVSFLLFSIVEYLMLVFVLSNFYRPFIPIIAVGIFLVYAFGSYYVVKSVRSGFLDGLRKSMEK